MHESNVWGAQRFTTLFVVLALHWALLALFLTASPTRVISDSTMDSVEAMFFPPTKAPKVRFENARLQRLTDATAISITWPWDAAPARPPPASGPEAECAAAK